MKTDDQLVSVCVITYNHEKYIHQALESILTQKTNFPFKIIVADDFSTDNTRNIIDEYAEKYPEKFNVLDHSKKYGIVQNFLRLLEAAEGKYVAYLEGDDYWTDPLKLQKQVDFLKSNPDLSGCFHNTEVVDENGNFLRLFLSEPTEATISQHDLVTSKTSHIGHTNSWIFLRDCILDLPTYFTKNPYDRLLAFLIAEKGKWGGIPEVMSAYRINQGGVYNSIGEIKQVKTMIAIFDAIAAEEKNYSRYANELRERLSFYHHRLMQLYKAEKNKSEYLKHLAKFVSFKEKNLSLLKVLIKEELLA